MVEDVALDLTSVPTEFVSELEKKFVPATELNFPRAHAFGEYEILFPKEASTHPAKMSTELLDYLIRKYTRKGDTVLDPMAGSGSTAVLAAYHGRNGVAVELEGRFVGWIKESQKRVGHLPGPHGKIAVIQGDSRRLTDLIREHVSTQMMSPPYADGEFWFGTEMHRKFVSKNHAGRKAWEQTGRGKLEDMRPDNIARLRMPGVDLVGTSPPYAESVSGKAGGKMNWGSKAHPKKTLVKYSDDPANIGNLKVDMAATSPPFGASRFYFGEKPPEFWAKMAAKTGRPSWTNAAGQTRRTIRGQDAGYSGPRVQISATPDIPPWLIAEISDAIVGHLVGSVIFSPPYADAKKGGEGDVEGLVRRWNGHAKKEWNTGMRYETPGRRRGLASMGSGYSDSPSNIGNLSLGDVDAEVSSPPFFSTKQEKLGRTPNKGNDWSRQLVAQHPGVDTVHRGDPRNIESVSALGSVDAAVTSSPYGNEALDTRRTDVRAASKYRKGGKFAEEKLADASITSVPYGSSGPFEDVEWLKRNAGHKLKDRIKGKEVPHFYSPEAEARYLERVGASVPRHPENIGRLRVDAEISSAPYGSAESGRTASGGIAKRGYVGPNGLDATLGSRLERKISADPRNLSNLSDNPRKGPETYADAMLKVYGEMFKVLKPGGRAIVVIKAFTRDGKNVDLPFITWKLLERVGFELDDVLKVRLKSLSFWRVIQYKKNPSLPQLLHEYVIVARRPRAERHKADK